MGNWCDWYCRVFNHSGLPRSVLVETLKVLHPGKPLTRTISHGKGLWEVMFEQRPKGRQEGSRAQPLEE